MPSANIAVGFSTNRAGEEAVKEASSQIKSSLFMPGVELCIVFFTPSHNPWRIKETLDITLRPHYTFGVQAPLLIYEDKILDKGVVVGAFSLEEMFIDTVFLDSSDDAQVESSFRKTFMKKMNVRKECVLSFFTPPIEVNQYLRGVRRIAGSSLKMFAAGLVKKYGVKNFQITNTRVDEGALNIILGGKMNVFFERAGGFLPVGKTFKITKAATERNLIFEIDRRPAALVYRKYLGNQFDIFRRASFGKMYPIGIKEKHGYRIVSVVEFLEGDALLCMGKVAEGMEGKIMVATPKTLLSSTEDSLRRIKHLYPDIDIALVFSTLTRKKILRKSAEEEISLIKTTFARNTKVIGIFSDYHVMPDPDIGEFVMEDAGLNLALFSYGGS